MVLKLKTSTYLHNKKKPKMNHRLGKSEKHLPDL